MEVPHSEPFRVEEQKLKDLLNAEVFARQRCDDIQANTWENGNQGGRGHEFYYHHIYGYDTTKIIDEIRQADEEVYVAVCEQQEVENILNENQVELDAWKEGVIITKDSFLSHGKKNLRPGY